MNIRNITVIGSGTMGNGIAHVFVQYGFTVTLNDIKKEFLDRGISTIKANLDRQVTKGTVTDELRSQTLSRISASTSLEESAKSADIVIEAATENETIKKRNKVSFPATRSITFNQAKWGKGEKGGRVPHNNHWI